MQHVSAVLADPGPGLLPHFVMAGLVPAIYVFWGALSQDSTMIKVTKLKYLGGYRLHATFSDGTAGEHDFSALVAESGPMGEPLRDPAYFARVFLEDGAPTWPNSFDMCPDWLRREIEAAGALKRDTAS
jgi:hypothetical protein